MLSSLLLICKLACLPTKITNNTTEAMLNKDWEVLKRAKKRCGEFYPNSPCVKEFIKKDPNNYYVICGGPSKV